MKAVAFDLETTGLNPYRDQILQIAAVVFDTEDATTPVEELPYFETLVRHDRYEGDAFALQMNAAILKRLAAGEGEFAYDALAQLRDFIMEYSPRDDGSHRDRRLSPVGFNVAAFDVAFVKAAGWDLFHHRPFELGSMFATINGAATSTDLTRRLLGREVTHDALQDARDAVSLFRLWSAGTR